MNKKRFFTMAILVFVVSGILAGCSSPLDDEIRESMSVSDLPHEMEYNGKPLIVNSVSVYEGKDTFGYNLFLVCDLDVSEFSEKELQELTDNRNGQAKLAVNAFITSEKNDLDNDSASLLGKLHLTDKKTLEVVLMSKIGTYPYSESFSGSKYTCTISIIDGDSNFPTRWLFCDGTVNNPPDVKTIPNPLHDQIGTWLNR